jgi:hypothetical protein
MRLGEREALLCRPAAAFDRGDRMATLTSNGRAEQLARNQIAFQGIDANPSDFVDPASGQISLCSACDHVRGIFCRDCFIAQGGLPSFYADYVSSAAGYHRLGAPSRVPRQPRPAMVIALVAVLFSSMAMSTEISLAKDAAVDFRAKLTTFDNGLGLLTHGRRCLGVRLSELGQQAQARVQDPDCAAL